MSRIEGFSLSDALNVIRRIELYQLAAKAVLVKVPDKDPKGYAELWGGFDPERYYAKTSCISYIVVQRHTYSLIRLKY
jgi:hypothetical protein